MGLEDEVLTWFEKETLFSGVYENTIRLCLLQNNNKEITQTWPEVCSSHMEGIMLFPVHGLRLAPQ